MSYNSVYYWKNFLEKDKEFGIKPDSFIVNFTIVNQSTNDIYHDWLSFPEEKALLGYIKYVVLPSGYYSRLFGEIKGQIFIDADNYDGVIDLLENNNVKQASELARCFKDDYTLLDKMEEKFDFKALKEFCNNFSANLDYHNIVFSRVELYANIKDVGQSLVREYEENGMIEELEEQMELSKEEIIRMFTHIEKNIFMLRRVNEFLKSKMLL